VEGLEPLKAARAVYLREGLYKRENGIGGVWKSGCFS
jgi:hypothetical protein